MSLFDALRYRLRVLRHPRDHERDVADEVDFHVGLETMQRAHAARGALSPRDARDVARRRFGNATRYREEARQIAGLDRLDVLQQDIRFAIRSFRRTPTFTAIVVLTLAIGIGANTAIFSAVDAVLLRPLPFFEPERLMDLSLTVPPRGSNPGTTGMRWSGPKFAVLRDAQTVFADLTMWRSTQVTVREGADAVRENSEWIDSHYLPVLGVRPILGRNFLPDEDRPGAPRVALLSHQMWQRVFNGDSAVLGAMLDVDGSPYTIVGVTPPSFGGLTGGAAFWISHAALPAVWPPDFSTNPHNHGFIGIGRLTRGVSYAQATAIMRELGARVDAAYPNTEFPGEHWGAIARPLDALRVDGRVRRTLFVLLGAVGLVLLIACANVANLFLVRASGRRREIAVRLAIGAGRGRLVRQLLVESVLLSALGGLASLIVAWWGVHALASLRGANVLPLQIAQGEGALDFAAIRLDVRAFAFAALLAVATGLLFGLVPALKATRPSLTDALRVEGAARSRGLRGLPSRNLLAIVEIALAVVLLAGSGLMIRSLGRLLAVRTGFDEQHVLSMRVNRAPNWSRDSIVTFYDRAIERLSAIPGVTEVALADCPPLGAGCGPRTGVLLRDRPPVPRGSEPSVGIHWVTPNWPTVMRVPLMRGRLFTRADRVGSPMVVLVSESAARAFWPGQDPIGRPLSPTDNEGKDTAYVVGVVGDVRFGDMDAPPVPDLYLSYYQAPMSYRMMLFLRTRGAPSSVANAARTALRDVAPGFPVSDVATLEQRVGASVANARYSAALLAVFAGMALALATVGVYGVISFSVAQRTREIGVRVALGATRGNVVRLIVGQGAALAAIGATCGVAAALALTGAMRSLLYEVQPTDAVTLAGIVALLLLAVLAASWIPARRAAGVPALQALRDG